MDFLTVAEVAAFTKRHPETITEALRGGELHGVQRVKRGRWLVRSACAEAWVMGAACPHAALPVAA